MAQSMQHETISIPTSHSQWPLRSSELAVLGFDKTASTKSSLQLIRHFSTSMDGRPAESVEIVITKKEIKISLESSPHSSRQALRLQSALLLCRVLAILPTVRPEPSALLTFLFPALESAAALFSRPYQVLLAENQDLRQQRTRLASRAARLEKESILLAAKTAELEEQVERQSQRMAALQSLPDQALGELLMDYLSDHKGRFNAAHFHSTHGVPVSRAEEGLRQLLAAGAVRKAKATYEPQAPQARQYETMVLPHFHLDGVAKAARSLFPKSKK